MTGQEIKDVKYAISVGVYLRGDDLDPEEMTMTLGVSPTWGQKRGNKIVSSSGREGKRKIGVWAVVSGGDSSLLDDHLNPVLMQLSKGKQVFTSGAFNWLNLPGVQEAYLDIFICRESIKPHPDIELEIPSRALSELSSLQLPIRFTVASTAP